MSSGQIWGKTFFVGKINISFLVSWAKVFGKLAKIFQQGCQNCFPRVLREPMKKWNSEKSFRLCLFGLLSNNFWHDGVSLGYGSHENVISRCPKDEIKKWKYNFFSLVVSLQLKFPALGTELRGWGECWGCQVFNVCVLWNHEGKGKFFVQIIHYLSFSGIESLSGSLFSNIGWKRVARCQYCIQYVQKNGLRRKFL